MQNVPYSDSIVSGYNAHGKDTRYIAGQMTKDEHLSKNTRQKIAEMMSLLPSNITEGKRSVMQRPSSLNVCMINTSSCRPPSDDYALVQTCTCLEN